MNSRHSLHYIDLHPEPVKTGEPPFAVLCIGAAAVAVALWVITVFLFTL